MTFKNIKIKMKGGKSRLQRVKVLASGKYKFVKNITKKLSKSSSVKSKTNPKKVYKKMAKNKSRRSRKFTIPLAPIAGLAAGMSIPVGKAMAGDYQGALDEVAWAYCGIHPVTKQFEARGLMYGTIPLIIGALVHKFVGGPPLNLNRMLASANVPLIRI